MRFPRVMFGFLVFPVFSAVLVSALYFPTAEVNVTLPGGTGPRVGLLPLMKLEAVGGEAEVVYELVSETAPGLLLVEGDELKVNGEVLEREKTVHSAVVSGRSGEETAHASVNLFLTGDNVNCEKAKRNLCFWDGALYQIGEKEEPPTPLGQLSSRLLDDVCKNYSLSYEILKGEDYVGVSRREKSNDWILSTRQRMTGEKEEKRIVFEVKCTVSSGEGTEEFQEEFEMAVAEDEEELGMRFEVVYDVNGSKMIGKNERVARGVITNPGGGDLEFSLDHDTGGVFQLKCVPTADLQKSSYECEVMTKRSVHLQSEYTAYVRVKEKSSDRVRRQNITLSPRKGGELAKLPTRHANLRGKVKFPEWVQMWRKAQVGARVAEPMIEGVSSSEVRRRVIKEKIKFEMVSGNALNVTEKGGIVFLAKKLERRAGTFRVKIAGSYPNGYNFESTMDVTVIDTGYGEGSCEKVGDVEQESSCSEKRTEEDCESTCGAHSGVLRRREGRPILIVGCSWRDNNWPEILSKVYQTCTPDLPTCPDRFCDPLEVLFPKICPQDCTDYVFGSANKDGEMPGIASATGVCSCDRRFKCLCSLPSTKKKSNSTKKEDRRRLDEILNDTLSFREKEAIMAVQASSEGRCGLVCTMSIIGGSSSLLLALFLILYLMYRRRVMKRSVNQRPPKEDVVNANYEEYVEDESDTLGPLAQGTSVKELPEYFDKKWEFPRHRLTIEKVIGEGEFGKVLKARADGIGGREGSMIVAVKMLKDNANEAELFDLISEYQLLKEIDHPNVIKLLGACTKLDGPLYVIIEYAKHGSLRNYLRKHRGRNGEEGTVTSKDILTFAWQVAKGMNYLTKIRLVHRDLAARNVLVAEGLICKISDFGLTRDIYEDEMYLKRSKGKVPVKWMALESLEDNVYTAKSDVWSYGVLLWELVTTGATPYPGIAGQELFNLLKNGYRMERPENCSKELYQILRSCWHENPSLRPTFMSLEAKLEKMLADGRDYLELHSMTAENKAYLGGLFEQEEEEDGEEMIQGVNEKGWEEEMWQEEEGEGIFMVEFNKRQKNRARCQGRNENLTVRYERFAKKRRYENEGQEDIWYVQPKGKPRPVEWMGREEEGEVHLNLN